MNLTRSAVENMIICGITNKEAKKQLRNAGHVFSNEAYDTMAKNIRLDRKQYGGMTTEVVQVSPEPAPKPEPLVMGEIHSPQHRRVRSTARTLVFTCAQNNTKLHDKFWQSLQQYIAHKDAELHVARITYNKNGMAAGVAKPNSARSSDQDELWYDERIVPYISDEAVQVTDDLVWCGELNILPTRADPLSNLGSYTRQASGIVPHVKMAMQSMPVMHGKKPRFLYSTGTVTQRNYIQKITGQVAEFHHVFGAMVVEIEGDKWWARQINADSEGVFFDKTTRYSPGGVSYGWNVECIVHGDVHIGKKDMSILNPVFDIGGVVDQLKPTHQFFHDIVDFTPRNHHNIKDPHFSWSEEAQVPVEREFREAATLLDLAERADGHVYVVVSNHDQAIGQWLRNTAAFFDPLNIKFWLEMNLYCATALKNGKTPHPFEHALARADGGGTYMIVKEDDSVVINGIEYGLHGHLGPNGARGSPRNLRVIGKAFTAHTHSAGITDGIYTVGVYGKLDMGYNKGPSSWSHTFGVTYQNGKRALYTFSGGEPWRNFDYQ